MLAKKGEPTNFTIAPQNLVAFARYRLGNKYLRGPGADIDVANFGAAQQKVLRTAIQNAVKEGRNFIKYSDYPTMGNGNKVTAFYKGARTKQNILSLLTKSFTDPVFEMFTTTGVFSFEKLGGGRFRIIEDEYNFDKSKSRNRDNPLDAYSEMVYAGQDISEEGDGYSFSVSGTL